MRKRGAVLNPEYWDPRGERRSHPTYTAARAIRIVGPCMDRHGGARDERCRCAIQP